MPIIRIGKAKLPPDCEITRRGVAPALSPKGDKGEHPVVSLARKHGCGILAEVGVLAGALASQVLKTLGDQIEEYVCVDPWKVYEEWADRPLWDYEQTQKYWESKYERVLQLSGRFKQIRIMRMTSVEAAKRLPDNHFDLVYLDGVHDFPNGINDIWSWLPKIKDDGIISGHDYYSRFIGYIRAVDFVFGEDHVLPEHSLSWHVRLSAERKGQYMDRVRERFDGDPESILNPENKQMYYRGKP